MSVVIFMNVIMKHLSCMLFFVKELCIIISKRMYYGQAFFSEVAWKNESHRPKLWKIDSQKYSRLIGECNPCEGKGEQDIPSIFDWNVTSYAENNREYRRER